MTPQPDTINWELLAGVALFWLAVGLLVGVTIRETIEHVRRSTGANDNRKAGGRHGPHDRG